MFLDRFFYGINALQKFWHVINNILFRHKFLKFFFFIANCKINFIVPVLLPE